MLELNNKNFEKEVLESEQSVLVNFWQPGCVACFKMKPIIEEVAKELEGKAKIRKLNLFETPKIAKKYRIPATPTFIIFKNGKPIERAVGLRTKQVLINKLNSLIKQKIL